MCSFRFRLFTVQTTGESNNVLISVDEKMINLKLAILNEML